MFIDKNWQTSVAGLLTAVGFVVTQLSNLLDNDAGTIFDLQGVVKAISTILFALGITWLGMKARDKNVSSEESGIPPSRTSAAAYRQAVEE